MSTIYLPKGSIMSWGEAPTIAIPVPAVNGITEHNRAALSINPERIEKKIRLANGSMRKWVTADKKTFGTSWDNLPHNSSFTVDGKWSADEMTTFYNSHAGAFTLEVKTATATTRYLVVFNDFNKSIEKRGRYDSYSLSLSMEEV